ncbi:MAG TPA: hypothetical protein VFQ05_16690 [Candidatus Eisenbacteria bacterium]|nr:hypothetical protein [Candidatus Eisenbacteria bacterium]
MHSPGSASIEPQRKAERTISPQARRSALMIAIAADVLQLGLLPLLGAGWLSPLNNAIDIVVGFVMVRRLGWHLAFLPTFIAELLPFVDIFPSWTLAVMFITRKTKPARETAGT